MSDVKAKMGVVDKLSIQVTDKEGEIILDKEGIEVRSHSIKGGKKLKPLESDTMNADGSPKEKDDHKKEGE